jgi:hypothetical protein
MTSLFSEGSTEVTLIGKTLENCHFAQWSITMGQNLSGLLDASKTTKFFEGDTKVPLEARGHLGRVDRGIGCNLRERFHRALCALRGKSLTLESLSHHKGREERKGRRQ